uniref:Uncharacterized protein n=1 Tax=Leptosiphonia brodiei TaxID=2608611 RepID=A0A1Z1MB50_9FLOR|nr:hypothetical protein [Leptosiphonia brodiei]ARW62984.1 hypothetical protein [Leptosiphonia brodiei]
MLILIKLSQMHYHYRLTQLIKMLQDRNRQIYQRI